MLTRAARQLESGAITAVTANAYSYITGKYISTFKVQMEYAKMIGQAPNIPELNPAVEVR